MDKICPCCNNHAHFRLQKGTVQYHQCTSCRTLFSDPLPNEGMVGGGNEIPRNTEQNHLRISRIASLMEGERKRDVNILDFGCGTGYLIRDLRSNGYQCDGFDAYNEAFSRLPEKNKYHIATAVEVIEHTSAPFVELDVVRRSLLLGGLVMIETSFVDVAQEEGVSLEDFFYINPDVGHSTVFSHHGLDVLMCLKGFQPMQHFNRHVRVYQKISSKW
jgi:SAM-dependent methyltransferase